MDVKVLVVDDQDLVRAGLIMLLGAQPDISVVGEAVDGAEAVESALRERPDVVVMDLQMPTMTGTRATEEIVSRTQESEQPVRVLILTTFSDDDALYPALRAGASGYLLKHAAPQDLPAAIRAVAAGQSWLDPRIAGRVMERVAQSAGPDGDGPGAVDGGRPAAVAGALESLTPRELEILTLMARGMTNRQIAEDLVLSQATVKTHVARVINKTGCHDRAQAVALAYQSGLTKPG